jgi:hypothetical protein
MCRKPFDEVADVECAHRSDPEMFHGGPIGQRAKRTGHSMPGHDCVKLGCNTAAVYAARREEAARRNGLAPDVRKEQTAAPAPQAPASRKTTRKSRSTAPRKTPAAQPAVIPVSRARAKKGSQQQNPLVLLLW